jgi:hypothetical protein
MLERLRVTLIFIKEYLSLLIYGLKEHSTLLGLHQRGRGLYSLVKP